MSQKEFQVLLVEEDANTREQLSRILRDDGWLLRTAATMVQALDVLDREAFDLALLGSTLPRGNGFELLRRLGSDAGRPAVPV
ncbi:MAG: response regulator, partial [Verrucomicrobiota bacterium]|nr:response regulator [Verrucomicrobiota bacterium]